MHLTNPWWGLTLAIIHGVAGIAILLVSSWFIAACALAGTSFNYVIPAVVIRGLAILRIASGYGHLWLSHHSLLAKLSSLRLNLFTSLENAYQLNKGKNQDALTYQTEQVASIWSSWIASIASSIITILLVTGVTLWLIPEVTSFWGLLIVAYLVLYVSLLVKGLTIAKNTQRLRTELQDQIEQHIYTSPIWHMNNGLSSPDMMSLSDSLRNQQRWLEFGQTALLSVSLILVVSLLPLIHKLMPGQAMALVIPMLLLSVNDWLGRSFENQPAFFAYLLSKNSLETAAQKSLSSAQKLQRTATSISGLTLREFKAQDTYMPPISLEVKKPGLVLMKGSSGSGKSRALMAVTGLIPFEGGKLLNGRPVEQGPITNAVYIDQTPYCLSGTTRCNLQMADKHATDARLLKALALVDLQDKISLDEWLGEKGRQLSGGEKKRLGMARAWLSNSQVLCIDEPFEALDKTNQNRICGLINELAKKHIVIVASHIFPEKLNWTHLIEMDKLKNDTPIHLNTCENMRIEKQ